MSDMRVPVRIMKSSAIRWLVVPTPALAMSSLSPWAFATAMSSRVFRAGREGCTTIASGTTATRPTGAISRKMS